MFRFKLLLGLSLLLLLSANVQAQGLKVPKMDLSSQVLGILNKTDGLGLDENQKSTLTKENSSFVDQLMNISNSDKSDDDKKTAFLGLKNNRVKMLTGLLGNDLFQKYSGQILKSINPLKSKLGLAALAF